MLGVYYQPLSSLWLDLVMDFAMFQSSKSKRALRQFFNSCIVGDIIPPLNRTSCPLLTIADGIILLKVKLAAEIFSFSKQKMFPVIVLTLTFAEFEEARRWVSESLTFERSVFVNFFEMSIRMLGGLLSAFHLTNDRLFVEKATDLAGRLVAAYSSQSAIPYSDVNLLSGLFY